ncbi:hypothetical protein [Nonomuraea sp. NPDC002799]
MSRSALLVWLAALAAAAYPTWDTWRPPPAGEWTSEVFGCIGLYSRSWDRSPLLPLRGDLGTMTELATTWGLPLLIVLAALGHRHSAAAGRRAAAALTLIAFVRPLTPWYAGDAPCGGPLRLLSLEWFETVATAFGPWESSLLIAALLVILATQPPGASRPDAGEPVILAPSRRRALTLLMDYLAVTMLVSLAIRLTGGWGTGLSGGLLQWLAFDELLDEPARLIFYPALVLYLLLRRRFVRRTPPPGPFWPTARRAWPSRHVHQAGGS